MVIAYCQKNNIGTIVVGKNNGFKRNVTLDKRNKQNFISIPYAKFLEYLTYKAEECGIEVRVTEESYTSKASFVDNDDMPAYNQVTTKDRSFSGNRVMRGLYYTKQGKRINADCNASGNIIRKVFPNAFNGRGDRGVVDTPCVLSIVS